MNWVDYGVLAIIGMYAIYGLSKGLVRSVFKLVSFIIAGFLSMQFYPVVSQILTKTFHLDTMLAKIIGKNLETMFKSGQLSNTAAQSANHTPTPGDINTLISSWSLPKSFETSLTNNLAIQANHFAGNLIDSVSKNITTNLINIISMLVVFAAASIVLICISTLLDGIASLPILSQINHAGGIIFGAFEGLVVVYIVFAILTIFASIQSMKGLFEGINASTIAKGLYNNNLLLLLLFGGKG